MSWIRKLDTGRYQAIYRDGAGHQRSRSFDREKDAKKFLAEQSISLTSGRWVDPRAGEAAFSRFIARWQLGRSVERSTDASDAGRITNHIVPAFGDWPTAAIRHLDVMAWMKTLERDKGLAPKTRRECLALLKMILDAAVIEGVIPANPAASVKPPPKVTPKGRDLTRAEVDAVLAKASLPLKARVALAAYAGPRWGEVCGLRRGSVDIARRTVTISETMEEINGHFHRKPYPKDRESRVLPLAGPVAEVFLDYLAAALVTGRPGDDDDALFFPSAKGTPIYRSNNDRALALACRKAGVRSFNFKDLRAFCASYLINECGVPVTAVRELLGHSKASMTLDVYTAKPREWHGLITAAFAQA